MSRDYIVNHRTDISSYLIHWTKKEHFWPILRSGFLIATAAPRKVLDEEYGEYRNVITVRRNNAVCFSEMPIGHYLQSTVAEKRYPRWGIAILKSAIYLYGGRPALYSDDDFIRKMYQADDDNLYRLSHFHPYNQPGTRCGVIDWSHEREWRVRPNAQINHSIGLKRDIELLHSHPITHEKTRGEEIVPIHFDHLPQPPRFVILVESEEDKARVTRIQDPARKPSLLPEQVIWKWLWNNEDYAPIKDYRDRYLNAFHEAAVISFEFACDERNRRDVWRIEDLIRKRKQYRIGALWNKARVQTRRQILEHVGELSDKQYEFMQWDELPKKYAGILPLPPGIRQLVEEDEQARELLESDVRDLVTCLSISDSTK